MGKPICAPDLPQEVTSALKNPCTGLCRFDPETGWCLGCARSRADCRDWKQRPETRPGIFRRLRERMAALRAAGRLRRR